MRIRCSCSCTQALLSKTQLFFYILLIIYFLQIIPFCIPLSCSHLHFDIFYSRVNYCNSPSQCLNAFVLSSFSYSLLALLLLQVRLDLGGVPVLARDTAGLRVVQISQTDGSVATLDPIEAEGIRRAWAAAAKAQLVLFVVDATNGPEAAAALAQLQAAVAESEEDEEAERGGLSGERVTLKDALLVLNKCDCEGAATDSAALMKAVPNQDFNDFFLQGGLGEMRVSCRT